MTHILLVARDTRPFAWHRRQVWRGQADELNAGLSIEAHTVDGRWACVMKGAFLVRRDVTVSNQYFVHLGIKLQIAPLQVGTYLVRLDIAIVRNAPYAVFPCGRARKSWHLRHACAKVGQAWRRAATQAPSCGLWVRRRPRFPSAAWPSRWSRTPANGGVLFQDCLHVGIKRLAVAFTDHSIPQAKLVVQLCGHLARRVVSYHLSISTSHTAVVVDLISYLYVASCA